MCLINLLIPAKAFLQSATECGQRLQLQSLGRFIRLSEEEPFPGYFHLLPFKSAEVHRAGKLTHSPQLHPSLFLWHQGEACRLFK